MYVNKTIIIINCIVVFIWQLYWFYNNLQFVLDLSNYNYTYSILIKLKLKYIQKIVCMYVCMYIVYAWYIHSLVKDTFNKIYEVVPLLI